MAGDINNKLETNLEQTDCNKDNDQKKYKFVDKRGPKAFTFIGNARAGDYIEQHITINKTDDFVSHIVYSMANCWMIHMFLKGKNISKDVKECFEYKIKDKKSKERLSESVLKEYFRLAENDVKNGKWPKKKQY